MEPSQTGTQSGVITASEPFGVPKDLTFLPNFLKQLGYSNHAVGKWHLGHYQKKFLPIHRGFDSHLGYWTGKKDYYYHTNQAEVASYCSLLCF